MLIKTITALTDPRLGLLQKLNELLYQKCGLTIENIQLNEESIEYGACSYQLNDTIIQHRVAKITATKIGQFVTIWKRNSDGITEPFNATDDFDCFIIVCIDIDKMGMFIFPKTVLIDNGIITKGNTIGKRGIRVYPSWDAAANNQAIRTQKWQSDYFIHLNNEDAIEKFLLLLRK